MMAIDVEHAIKPYAREDQFQRDVANVLDQTNLLWFHAANERKCSARTGSMLKAAGVKRGVPDIMILERVSSAEPGVAIELKAGRNPVTSDQKIFMVRLNCQGWHTAVCRTLAEVLEIIERHYPGLIRRDKAQGLYLVCSNTDRADMNRGRTCQTSTR